MTQLFLDTSFVLALEIASDQNHGAARNFWQQMRTQPPQLLSTSFVFNEILTFLNNRSFHSKAVEVGNYLLNSSALEMVNVDQELLRNGFDYLIKHDDKRFSLTDCVSFVLMTQRKIAQALTFDHHFTQAGFQILT